MRFRHEAVSKVIRTGFCHSDPASAGEESLIINELDISSLACPERFGKLSTGSVEGLNMTNKSTFETASGKVLILPLKEAGSGNADGTLLKPGDSPFFIKKV